MSNDEVLVILRAMKDNFEEYNQERPEFAETGTYICKGISKAIEDLKKYYNVDG